MNPKTDSRQPWLIVIVTAAFTLGLHYSYGLFFSSAGNHSHFLHLIHGRLCYIPIVLGAVFWGLKGGLGTATAITLIIAPYLIWIEAGRGDLPAEMIEIVFYFAFGAVTGFFVDRAEKQRLQKEEAQKRLVRADQLSMLGTMAAGIAHEIKNPLGAIRGAAEILTGDISPERSVEFKEILKKETSRLDRTAQDFLSYANPAPVTREPVSLQSLIAETVAACRLQSSAKSIAWNIAADQDVSITGDAIKLGRALANLAMNAVEACADKVDGRVRIRLEFDATQAWIRVEDNGVGVDPADRDYLFTPFFTKKSTGTGLGVATARQIAVAHGGDLFLEPEGTEGATFVIQLPRSQ